MAAAFTGYAQEPSAALQVDATDKAVLLPRVANVGLIATPVNGMIVYDISSNCVRAYENNAWSSCLSPEGATAASDAVLAQIGNEGDDPDVVNSVVTVAQLNQILPALTGVDAGNETAYQDYIDANPNSFSSPATAAEVQAMVDAVNAAAGPMPVYCTGSPTAVVDVVGAAGDTWMDRNLGATQVANISTDAAAYGDLYQWGRFADGHQCRTSSTTTTNATTAVPNDGNAWDGLFITESSSPLDWLSTQDNTLWDGVSGTNNPCPSGYRLPTETEWDTERSAWGSNNAAGAFESPLKLPVAGFRNSSNGALGNVGSNGYYWSSTVSGTNARRLRFYSSTATMDSNPRAYGFSVRCLKE